ncbi:MAG: YraN family protein [Clostridia bacterium]|nr:YraN family protein [Clostridia bacterium]
MTTTDIGRYGEDIAANYLKKNGYKILERNRHQSHNEIDIIAVNKEFIVFVEVKTRSVENDLYSEYGTPASAVTRSKQFRLISAAKSYMYATKKHYGRQPRMDVIEVYLSKYDGKLLNLNHIIDAFGE